MNDDDFVKCEIFDEGSRFQMVECSKELAMQFTQKAFRERIEATNAFEKVIADSETELRQALKAFPGPYILDSKYNNLVQGFVDFVSELDNDPARVEWKRFGLPADFGPKHRLWNSPEFNKVKELIAEHKTQTVLRNAQFSIPHISGSRRPASDSNIHYGSGSPHFIFWQNVPSEG